MSYRKSVVALRTQTPKKHHYFDHSTKSTDSHNAVGLQYQCKALPAPQSGDQPSLDKVGYVNALDALESSDYLKIKAALARVDPRALLDQLDKPQRPKWQTMINDWVSVKVPAPVFDEWNALRHEQEHLYFEYNRTTEEMAIKCMPTSVHEAVPSRFVEQAIRMKYTLSRTAQREIITGTTEDFDEFCDSNMNITSVKEADGFVTLKNRTYPLVVIESGWSECVRDLRADARLWLWGTEPRVQFVFVVEHVETKVLRDDRPDDKKWKLDQEDIEEVLSSGEPIELMNSPTDDNARQRALKELLLKLHYEDKLMKPLLGSVKSTLYIYRRRKDDDDNEDPAITHMSVPTNNGLMSQDIYCHFEAEIYPNNTKKEMKLQLRDILGGDIPQAFAARDLQKYFCVDLEEYRDSVERSLEKHTKRHAKQRAVAILERRHYIPHLPSHAEQKKGSGPNMLDGQAADGPYVPSGKTGTDDSSSGVLTSPRQKNLVKG